MKSASIIDGLKPQGGADSGFIDRLVKDYTYMLSRSKGFFVSLLIPEAVVWHSNSRNSAPYQSQSSQEVTSV